METTLAIVIGGLYAISFYLMLRRSMVKLILGLVLFSQAVNLLIFTAAGLTRGQPPIIPEGADALPVPFADPLPQALILTAIVISFGIFAFTLALTRRAHSGLKTDDLDELGRSDRL
jgi:multicomponent Na+:H+ antiporter subunit C